ncbi:hypothetical protein TruAng_001873 [Truncatella angustata]|nr:hypothetical protein TruAng_001873 [Truncatella angustata]
MAYPGASRRHHVVTEATETRRPQLSPRYSPGGRCGGISGLAQLTEDIEEAEPGGSRLRPQIAGGSVAEDHAIESSQQADTGLIKEAMGDPATGG